MIGSFDQKELISVIIVNHNGKNWLSDCLESIFKQTYPHFEIIIVDNASTDGSQSYIRACFKS